MKAVDIVKAYLEPKCKYSGLVADGFAPYTCRHEDVAEVKNTLRGQPPDEPCTMADWKECPLNTAPRSAETGEPKEMNHGN